MRINVYSVEKKQNSDIKNLVDEYIKMSMKLAKIEDISLFDKKILQAHNSNSAQAQKSYTEAFTPLLNGFNISLDVNGEKINSQEFANLLSNHNIINFFIGGAYGFENKFLAKTQKVISLSTLTYAHKIAKLVLFEQIYRGLCIKEGHPYHK